jgi:hypothetical protein
MIEYFFSTTEQLLPTAYVTRHNDLMHKEFRRTLSDDVLRSLRRDPPLIQIVTGARQVGKTTVAMQVAAVWEGPVRFAAADGATPHGPEWLESEWLLAATTPSPAGTPLLIVDEVQKVIGWNEVVKACWDADRRARRVMRVLLLGSSALLLAKGRNESLAGRFFLHRCPHWTLAECQAAFGFDLDQWLYHGGYPGAASLVGEPDAWRAYVNDSLIETVIARDVLALHPITKPALLRHLFALIASFPAQILSYNKMLGQLHDAGNTTTLASYLRALETAFLVSGLERFSAGRASSRGSSPKLVLWNNALVSAAVPMTFTQARNLPEWWGRLVENAVGAHLVNHLQSLPYEVTYWREGNDEVDYVVQAGRRVWAIEVKSGRPRGAAGLAAFRHKRRDAVPLVVGSGGLALADFFREDPRTLLDRIAS